MTLSAGTRLGPYEILAPIGAGGMGEVYRARDTRLNRDVALKVLPDAFASDADRLARFEREAQVLASLNHPHIAAIYGLESRALVMELVEGETLAARIGRGPLPQDEALGVARQIADALEAAHGRGVIHRDLKPANICITADGAVKVLDFGLAKLVEARGTGQGSGAGGSASMSPTITSPALMTSAGVLLGTAAYMSPEQAKGRDADQRSDIWAFGCVLFEMLAGTRPFGGGDVADTLAATLMREPNWAALPAATPPGVRRLLDRCLRKDPRQRLHAITDARLELEDVHAGRDERVQAVVPPSRLRAAAPWAIAAVLLAVAATEGWWLLRAGDSWAPAVGFSIAPPPGLMPIDGSNRIAAVSPDGRRVVVTYVRDGIPQLYLRDLDALSAVAIPGTERATDPFFSHDGRWIAFTDRDMLKKVSVDGGAVITITDASWGNGTWGPDDTIIYTRDYSSGLWQAPAGGGPAKKLTDPDPERGELGHWYPQLLPDGKTVLFTAFQTPAEKSRIYLYSLDTGERRLIVDGGMHARYAASGHLLFARASTLMAVPFDLGRLRTTGQAVPVLDGVSSFLPNGVSQFSVSTTGTLTYVPVEQAPRRLVWIDRRGDVETLPGITQQIDSPRLSPDGRRAALTARDATDTDVWMYDLARAGMTRVTFGPGAQFGPIWAAGAPRLFFAFEEPVFHVYVRDPDAAGDPQRVLDGPDDVVPTSTSPDGQVLVYNRNSPKTRDDIWALPLADGGMPRPLVQTPFSEQDGTISPDGRWLAYESDETGRNEVYVQRFADGGGRVQVSTSGGSQAVWSRDGRELFFRNVDRMMAVAVSGTEPTLGRPALLFEVPLEGGFDVARDGRFLAVQRDPAAPPTPVHVMMGWFDELRRRFPAD